MPSLERDRSWCLLVRTWCYTYTCQPDGCWPPCIKIDEYYQTMVCSSRERSTGGHTVKPWLLSLFKTNNIIINTHVWNRHCIFSCPMKVNRINGLHLLTTASFPNHAGETGWKAIPFKVCAELSLPNWSIYNSPYQNDWKARRIRTSKRQEDY